MVRRIVAWDGEGVTDDQGDHHYILMANSLGKSVAKHPPGLHTADAFRFMLEHSSPGDLNVIYGGSYDANMAFKSMSVVDATRIWASEKGCDVVVLGKTYRVRYRPRKSLELRRYAPGERFIRAANGQWVRNIDKSIVLWDVIGFFQSSFVKAVELWFTPTEREELMPQWEMIRRMKAERSSFSAADMKAIAAYSIEECRILTLLMERLRASLLTAELRPSRWDGAGAVAKALLKKHKSKEELRAVDPAMHDAVRAAYAGGRIELCQIGNVGRCWDYDINSAYPSTIAELPSLPLEWEYHAPYHAPRTISGEEGGLYYVEWDFPRDLPWYPLYYRMGTGEIFFPASGKGWYWSYEVDAAWSYRVQMGGVMRIISAWLPVRDRPVTKPFAWVAELYTLRQKLKKRGDGAEKVYKLGLNSLYGAFCQQLGGSEEKPPPYHHLAYAGMITSATRAKLVIAGLRSPEAIVAFMTDGIFSRSPLGLDPMYPVTSDLGMWSYKEYEPGVLTRPVITAQPGVYWIQRDDGSWESRYRGFDAGSLDTPDAVMEAWKSGERHVTIPSTRFQTLGASLAGGEQFSRWCRWITTPRELDISGASTKRLPIKHGARPDVHGYVLEVAENVYYEKTGASSAPYELAWTMKDEDADEFGE